MKVRNKKAIRRLSIRTLRASGKRNMIAAAAIALTTLLFTSLFTIALSINASYETYTFRQIGGYSHGTFKEVSEVQAKRLSEASKVKAAGERKTLGTLTEGGFSKVPAELSFMDENCAKWSYIDFEKGEAPQKENEIVMDTEALKLLGVKPEIGAKVTLTYDKGDQSQDLGKRTDTFRLSGWWEYDELTPVHFINLSRAYVETRELEAVSEGAEPFRTDLNVMLASSVNIRGNMEEIVKDCGYQSQKADAADYVGVGVNWGYTASQADSSGDFSMIVAVAAFLLLVIFAGYLIIYNIFRISVTGDIRYYGLLKTISASPIIFAGAAAFSIATVLLSCARPARLAAKVSPVEAAKYTETSRVSKRKRAAGGAGIRQMAFANLGRSRGKTALMVLSMSLAVVILSVLLSFTGGFSMEKYLNENTCADFIVGNTDYFRLDTSGGESGLSPQTVKTIQSNTKASLSGQAWNTDGAVLEWIPEARLRQMASVNMSEENLRNMLNSREKRGDQIACNMNLEGLDVPLMEKLTVLEGDIAPMTDPDRRVAAVAVDTDDYGRPDDLKNYPQVGDKIPVTYVDEAYYIDSRTGKRSDETTPEQYRKYQIEKSHDEEYTVCAHV